MRSLVDFLASVGPGLVVLGLLAIAAAWIWLIRRRSLGSLGTGPLNHRNDAIADPSPHSVEAKRIADELTMLNGALEIRLDRLSIRAGLAPAAPGVQVYDSRAALASLDARLDAIEAALDLPPLEPSAPRPPKATP